MENRDFIKVEREVEIFAKHTVVWDFILVTIPVLLYVALTAISIGLWVEFNAWYAFSITMLLITTHILLYNIYKEKIHIYVENRLENKINEFRDGWND